MNSHRYLRAYMAGSAVPTMMLLVVLSGFLIARYTFQIPYSHRARHRVSDGAGAESLWASWNMFFFVAAAAPASADRAFMARSCPFILAPAGLALAACLGFLSANAGGLVWFHEVAIPYATPGGRLLGSV
jgi:hypothetical protein